MFSASHLARLLATLPLALLVHAQNYNITISEVEIFPCPFKIQVSAASNLSYIDIVYSTKGTTPNSLASYGDSKSSNKRRCYTNTLIRHPELFARARPLRMEMSGSVKLEAGLTAKIETGLVWSTMQSMTNFSTAQFSGPIDSTFTHRATITNRAHAASCQFSTAGLRSEPRTLAESSEPHLTSYFTISGAGAGIGTIGEEADLTHRIYLEWLEGCGSWKQWYDCITYNRYDQPKYLYPANASTPDCVDHTRPPPS